MPELRKAPVLGRWVIITTEQGKRPTDFEVVSQEPHGTSCPFVEGYESETQLEVYAVRDEYSAPGTSS